MNKLILVFTLCGLALPIQVNSLPIEGLTPYKLYRKELINMGWRPVPNNFGRGNTPEVPDLPELICARTFCTGIFKTPMGKKTLKLLVWMNTGLDTTEYYVAPSINFFDEPKRGEL